MRKPKLMLLLLLVFVPGSADLFDDAKLYLWMAPLAFPADCSETSDAVAYARAIPKEELESVFLALKSYGAKGEYFYRTRKGAKNAPKELENIDYQNLILSPYTVRLMLEGCFDHFVTIRFDGVLDGKEPAVVLAWGEGPTAGSEILWNDET